MVIILGISVMILFTIGKCFVIVSYTAGNTLENKLKKKWKTTICWLI